MKNITMTCSAVVTRDRIVAVPSAHLEVRTVAATGGVQGTRVSTARLVNPVFGYGDAVVTVSGIHQPSIESPPV